MNAAPAFHLITTTGRARCGRIDTAHGPVETPAFMPVGSAAAVRGLTPRQVRQAGTQLLLANTYHLMLRPGVGVVERLGGLHAFMGWDGPILTDSGGFQVFSLAERCRVDEDGVSFRSHVDGAPVRLTPESATEVQNRLGADIVMAFDQCPPLPGPPEALAAAVRRTVQWARRCKAAHRRADQALWGIVQGGLDPALRRACLDELLGIGFDGYAIGGLSVGETTEQMTALLDQFADRLPPDKPRYLMGVGTPDDLLRAVAAGVDLFDCVLPTRNGRKGYAFTSAGIVRLRNSRHRESGAPLDAACDCECCRTFSRGYLRHLFASGEQLGGVLVSLHNLTFYQSLMRRMREAISAGEFEAFRAAWLAEARCRPADDARREPSCVDDPPATGTEDAP